ncbi:MAG: translation elongation factor Ts [Gammaproteobacteria bacterium]|nr:translation elongation factor Ts [Gammaproteobacteria bacterium]
MADISAQLVKELRERTGAGMMECKKALVATAGDVEKAVDELRKSGVARDNNFTDFVSHVAKQALKAGKEIISEIGDLASDVGSSIDAARKELITKIGENISLRRAVYIKTAHHVGTYIHSGRIGVMVELEGGDAALARDLAMHIAASNPLVISGEDLPADVLAKEREIFTAQTKESGKPPEIIEKMVEGRIRKYLEEVSLLGQYFVKDPSLTVSALLQQRNAKVLRFVRFTVGEGIEKQETDFVAEVMAYANAK